MVSEAGRGCSASDAASCRATFLVFFANSLSASRLPRVEGVAVGVSDILLAAALREELRVVLISLSEW